MAPRPAVSIAIATYTWSSAATQES